MAHTLPDYTTKYKLSKIFSQVDVAELAARINGLSTIDRRGNLVWYDDFEAAAAVKWYPSISAGGTAAISTDRSLMGASSMKCVTHTDLGDMVELIKELSLPIDNTIGAEAHFRLSGGKPICSITLVGYSGTYQFIAQLRYNSTSGVLTYWNSAGGDTSLTIYDDVDVTYEHWFYMKLAINFATAKYLRAIFNSTNYDLSAAAMQTTGSAAKKRLAVTLAVEAGTAAAATCYIDNFILTQNEP